MKKFVSLLMGVTLVTCLLAGCGSGKEETKAETKAETTAETTAAAEGAEDHSDLKLTIYSAVFDDETQAICESSRKKPVSRQIVLFWAAARSLQEFRQKKTTRQPVYGSAVRLTHSLQQRKRGYYYSMNPRMQLQSMQNTKMPIITGQVFILAM